MSFSTVSAEGERGEQAVDGTTLSEGENATARTTTTMPISPPQQGNSRVSGATSMTKTRTFNDNSHSLKRRKRKLMGLYGAPRDVAPLFSI